MGSLAMLLLAGCVSPATDSAPGRQQNVLIESAPLRLAGDSAYAAQLERDRTLLKRCLPGDDLIEDLYYGWMLEPYRRATLAVAVKTTAVLERELDLRQRGAGALSAGEIAQMFAWLDRVFAGSWAPQQIGFSPQRIDARDSVAPDELGSGGGPYFTFADRATFTRQDTHLGDFDLLASAGFRVYALATTLPMGAAQAATLSARADALGIPIADARVSESEAAPAGSAAWLWIRPVTLADLLDGAADRPWATEGQGVAALIDPAAGESWAGMRARRALYIGATGHKAVAVGCVPPAEVGTASDERMVAALWSQALDGQHLGVIEGWRDRRDGLRTAYASLFADPALLESAAHASLNMLRYREVIARCAHVRRAVLVVNRTHLDVGDPNAWSPGLIALLRGLGDRQAVFGIVPRRVLDGPVARRRFDTAIVLPDFDANGPVAGAELRRIHWAGGDHADETATPWPQSIESCAALIADWLAEDSTSIRAVRVEIADGGAAGSIQVCAARDGLAVGLVNLGSQPRQVRLGGPGGKPDGTWNDVLVGARVGPEVALAPFQARLLVP